MMYYCLLSGPDYELAKTELYYLLKTYSIRSRIRNYDEGRIAVFNAEGIPENLPSRPALTKEIGEVYKIFKDKEKIVSYASSIKIPHSITFKVDSEGFDYKEKLMIDSEVGALIAARGNKVSLKKPDITIRIIKAKELYLLGRLLTSSRGRWFTRRPRARPFFHPSALYPKLARLLVNLSMVKEDEVLLDPCSGTGSILIEGEQVNASTVGIEISKNIVHGCMKNLSNLKCNNSELIQGDARYIPLRKVDAIATDPPYGRASSNMGIETRMLRRAILVEASRLLKSGRLCVMVSPSSEPPGKVKDMKRIYLHRLYVHRSLTRLISVYRRE